MELRYGINPHQIARAGAVGAAPMRLVHSTASYINVLDALNAWQLVREANAAIGAPAAASFKHVSPAGAAVTGDLDETMRDVWGMGDGDVGDLTSAYVRARDCDPKSSFGDMIAVSAPVDAELADLLSRVIADGIIAPGFEPGTVEVLARKKRGTFLVFEAEPLFEPPVWERREVFGMVLEQQCDRLPITAQLLQVIAGTPLTPPAVADAVLGMIALRYTQSNSVACVLNGMTLGIGAGQQSRVDCTKLAGAKAAIWWLRRHPIIGELSFPPTLSRQDRLNWQIRFAEGDMTPAQRADIHDLVGGGDDVHGLSAEVRSDWLRQLDNVTLVSDGYIPFRDNIDYASRYGVRYVVEPGGSLRSPDVAAACHDLGMTLVHTGTRLFHH